MSRGDPKGVLRSAEEILLLAFCLRFAVIGVCSHGNYCFEPTLPSARLFLKFSEMMAATNEVVHLNFDDAWDGRQFGFATLDLRGWGPRLRFSAPGREIERFAAEEAGALPPSLVYGSGDFHHLTAVWLRRFSRLTTVVSFDNHPDWDVRPPRWACGAWVNRALELSQIAKVSVWGCGNFECWWPARITGNNWAERAGRLELHPWADDRSAQEQKRRGAILRSNWRENFEEFLERLSGGEVYVTIDLDCVRAEEAVTNWESGRFSLEDLTWALKSLGTKGTLAGWDICGAWSPPRYARWKQRFAANFDHPKIILPSAAEIRRRNHAALDRLLPLLTQ